MTDATDDESLSATTGGTALGGTTATATESENGVVGMRPTMSARLETVRPSLRHAAVSRFPHCLVLPLLK